MAECFTPVQIRLKDTNDNAYVPCGKCPSCVGRRTSNWSFRLMQEERYAQSCWFITLTYDNAHLPRTANGFKTLRKKDVQNFFKRLRKLHGTSKIKYYVAGEYGGKTRRPHYHIILFNADVKKIAPAWNINGKGMGDIFYGSVTGASVGYCLKYLSKDKSGKLHSRDDRQCEFQLQSKGLGLCYLTPAMVRWHRQDLVERMYCNSEAGGKIPMPRYYKGRIYSDRERVWVSAMAHDLVLKRNDEIRKRREAESPTYARDLEQAIEAKYRVMRIKSTDKTFL